MPPTRYGLIPGRFIEVFMADDKSKLEAQVLAQMRQLRSQIDPDVLARARNMAQKQQEQAAKPQLASRQRDPQRAIEGDTVPYDSKSAQDVVRKFLEDVDDPEEFQQKLHDYIRANLRDH